MQNIQCESCGEGQPSSWKSGDLCSHCGGTVRHEVRCGWCTKWTPKGNFCRECGTNLVPLAEFSAARILKKSGVDQFTLAERLAALDPEQVQHFDRLYQKHYALVIRIVDEMRFCEQSLILNDHSQRLEDSIIPGIPYDDADFSQLEKTYSPSQSDSNLNLLKISQQSPVEITRLLAALAMIRDTSFLTLPAADREEVLNTLLQCLSHESEYIVHEASICLTHWVFKLPHARKMLDRFQIDWPSIFSRAKSLLENEQFGLWAAVACDRLSQWNPDSDLSDQLFNIKIETALQSGMGFVDSELQFTCALQLNENTVVLSALSAPNERKAFVAARHLAKNDPDLLVRYIPDASDQILLEIYSQMSSPVSKLLVDVVTETLERENEYIKQNGLDLLAEQLDERVTVRIVSSAQDRNDADLIVRLVNSDKIQYRKDAVAALLLMSRVEDINWTEELAEDVARTDSDLFSQFYHESPEYFRTCLPQMVSSLSEACLIQIFSLAKENTDIDLIYQYIRIRDIENIAPAIQVALDLNALDEMGSFSGITRQLLDEDVELFISVLKNLEPNDFAHILDDIDGVLPDNLIAYFQSVLLFSRDDLPVYAYRNIFSLIHAQLSSEFLEDMVSAAVARDDQNFIRELFISNDEITDKSYAIKAAIELKSDDLLKRDIICDELFVIEYPDLVVAIMDTFSESDKLTGLLGTFRTMEKPIPESVYDSLFKLATDSAFYHRDYAMSSCFEVTLKQADTVLLEKLLASVLDAKDEKFSYILLVQEFNNISDSEKQSMVLGTVLQVAISCPDFLSDFGDYIIEHVDLIQVTGEELLHHIDFTNATLMTFLMKIVSSRLAHDNEESLFKFILQVLFFSTEEDMTIEALTLLKNFEENNDCRVLDMTTESYLKYFKSASEIFVAISNLLDTHSYPLNEELQDFLANLFQSVCSQGDALLSDITPDIMGAFLDRMLDILKDHFNSPLQVHAVELFASTAGYNLRAQYFLDEFDAHKIMPMDESLKKGMNRATEKLQAQLIVASASPASA